MKQRLICALYLSLALLTEFTPVRAETAPITISVKRSQETVDFAASELRKYINLMAGQPEAAVLVYAAQKPDAALQLGLFTDFGLSLDGVKDPEKDDAIRVRVDGSKGIIAGSNPRSDRLGIGGYVSCQNLRALLPTGYPIFMHGRLLWDPAADTATLARDYFDASLGKDGQACQAYLKKLSELFHAPSIVQWRRQKAGWIDPQAAQKLREVPSVVEAFRPVIERNLDSENRFHAQSWRHLQVHADFATLFSRTLGARAEGKQALADFHGTRLLEYLQVNEDRIQPVFDLWWFMSTVSGQRIFQVPARMRGGIRR